MQKVQHTLAGVLVAGTFICASFPSLEEAIIVFVMVPAGSIFPDIDTPFMHRAIAHNVFIPLILISLAPLFPFTIFFVAGILLHLLLDVFSEGNIRLTFPIDMIMRSRFTDLLNLDWIRGVPNDSFLGWIVTGVVTGVVCGVILIWYGIV